MWEAGGVHFLCKPVADDGPIISNDMSEWFSIADDGEFNKYTLRLSLKPLKGGRAKNKLRPQSQWPVQFIGSSLFVCCSVYSIFELISDRARIIWYQIYWCNNKLVKIYDSYHKSVRGLDLLNIWSSRSNSPFTIHPILYCMYVAVRGGTWPWPPSRTHTDASASLRVKQQSSK